jgi:hypothetical protein
VSAADFDFTRMTCDALLKMRIEKREHGDTHALPGCEIACEKYVTSSQA